MTGVHLSAGQRSRGNFSRSSAFRLIGAAMPSGAKAGTNRLVFLLGLLGDRAVQLLPLGRRDQIVGDFLVADHVPELVIRFSSKSMGG